MSLASRISRDENLPALRTSQSRRLEYQLGALQYTRRRTAWRLAIIGMDVDDQFGGKSPRRIDLDLPLPLAAAPGGPHSDPLQLPRTRANVSGGRGP